MQNPVLILGASGVIGTAIARSLSVDRPVLLHGLGPSDQLETLTAEINSGPCDVESETADLSDQADTQALFARIREKHGKLGGLVFAIARPFPHKLTHRTDWAVFQEQIDSQLKALHLSLACALPLLEKQEAETRVIIMSTEYVLGSPPVKIAPYVAAKSALTAYARTIAQEWVGRGVRVHILAPGMVESRLTADLPEMYIAEIADGLPEKRLTTAEDVAAVAKFLMSAQADTLYGTVVPVSRAQRR